MAVLSVLMVTALVHSVSHRSEVQPCMQPVFKEGSGYEMVTGLGGVDSFSTYQVTSVSKKASLEAAVLEDEGSCHFSTAKFLLF